LSYTTDSDLNEERRKLAYERSAQPREYFARLRAQGRVDDAENPDQPLLLHREDVEYALRNWQEYSSEFGGVMGSEEPIIPLNVDPPVHVKYRRLLDPYFSPRKMAALQPAVASHTNAWSPIPTRPSSSRQRRRGRSTPGSAPRSPIAVPIHVTTSSPTSPPASSTARSSARARSCAPASCCSLRVSTR
jgi:hypothetical protein